MLSKIIREGSDMEACIILIAILCYSLALLFCCIIFSVSAALRLDGVSEMIDDTICAVSCCISSVYGILSLERGLQMLDDTTFATFAVGCAFILSLAVGCTVILSLAVLSFPVTSVEISLFERILQIPPAPRPVNNDLKPIQNANIPPSPRPVNNHLKPVKNANIPPAPSPVNNHMKPVKKTNIPPAPRPVNNHLKPVKNANAGLDLTPVAQSPRMDLTPATIQSPEVIFAVNYENKGGEITQKKDDDNASEDNEQEVIFATKKKRAKLPRKKMIMLLKAMNKGNGCHRRVIWVTTGRL